MLARAALCRVPLAMFVVNLALLILPQILGSLLGKFCRVVTDHPPPKLDMAFECVHAPARAA